MPGDLDRLDQRLREELRNEVDETTYEAKCAPLELAALTGGLAYIRAPRHVRAWAAERLGPSIARSAERAFGHTVEIELVDEGWTASAPIEDAPASAWPGLNPKYTFGQFVIGPGTRMAHAAALQVAEMPAHAYNPLFLHGSPGTGKTHLLQAIGNYVQLHGLGLTVRYATVETFTSDLVRAIKDRSTGPFKDSFRSADVLLIDDVQFLSGKERTMEEFFHTFDALYESGRQLVLSSDQPPWRIHDVEERLLERFSCGLVAELEPPGLAVRLAILRARARRDALTAVPEETLQAIAEHVTQSARALEGALIRVVAYASLRGTDATPEVARHVLGRLAADSPATRPTVDEVIAATADTFGLEPEALLAHDRRGPHVRARQAAMYLARELTDESLPAIGRRMGGRRHSTVLNAHRTVARSVAGGDRQAATVLSLRERLERGS